MPEYKKVNYYITFFPIKNQFKVKTPPPSVEFLLDTRQEWSVTPQCHQSYSALTPRMLLYILGGSVTFTPADPLLKAPSITEASP